MQKPSINFQLIFLKVQHAICNTWYHTLIPNKNRLMSDARLTSVSGALPTAEDAVSLFSTWQIAPAIPVPGKNKDADYSKQVVLGADFTFSQQTTSISVKPVQHASRRCVSDFIICWYGSSHCVLWRRLMTLLLIWKNLTPALLWSCMISWPQPPCSNPLNLARVSQEEKVHISLRWLLKKIKAPLATQERNNQTLNGEFNPINENHIFC